MTCPTSASVTSTPTAVIVIYPAVLDTAGYIPHRVASTSAFPGPGTMRDHTNTRRQFRFPARAKPKIVLLRN